MKDFLSTAEIDDLETAKLYLRQSMDGFNLLFNSSLAAMALTDMGAERVLVRINKRYEEMFGYREDEVIGRNSIEIGILDEAEHKRAGTIIKEKGRLQNEKVQCWTKEGKKLFIIASLEEIEMGGKKYLLSIFQDITEIVEQQRIIKLQNQEITDSINCAKRIQQAKLPKREDIYSAFPDSFILFKPKAIVSGDFYYFHRIDNSVFIAAADCTGHGVPGALMSMICSEKLDNALAHSTDTSIILSHLNKRIKSSLSQSDSHESIHDGMDIAFCLVDEDSSVVRYAGANRPIWIIRNGQTVIEEIKGTKKAIGGFTEDNQLFETHTLQLYRGDTFYLFSDGYSDTFGGENNKKLTSKRFKELLLSIQGKPLKDQELDIDNFIEDWKAGIEQVDDILVIGVRL